MYDESEEDRLEHIQIAKSRGKGAPKKKRSAAGEFTRFVLMGAEWGWWGGEGGGLWANANDLLQRAGRSLGRSGSLASLVWEWIASVVWEAALHGVLHGLEMGDVHMAYGQEFVES